MNFEQLTNDTELSFPYSPNSFKAMIKETVKKSLENLKTLSSHEGEVTVSWLYDLDNYALGFLSCCGMISLHQALLGSKYEKTLTQAGEKGVYLSEKLLSNKKIYKKLKSISKENLNESEKLLLDATIKGFDESGINFSKAKRKEISLLENKINALEITLTSNAAKAEDSSSLIFTPDEVKGISDEVLKTIKKTEEGNYQFFYHNYSEISSSCSVSETRAKVLSTCQNLAPENAPLFVELLSLREEKARLYDFKSYTEMMLKDKMEDSFSTIIEKLNLVQAQVKNTPFDRLIENQKISDEDYLFTLEMKKRDINQEEIKKFFPFPAVWSGINELFKKIFSLEFKEDLAASKMHKAQQIYNIEKDGVLIGRLMLDLWQRKNKNNGAFADEIFVAGNKNFPYVVIGCDFTKDKDQTLTFDGVLTILHELGHALHSVLGRHQSNTLSAFGVSQDFVELPSQIMEEWFYEPEVMKSLSKHVKTAAQISDEMIAKIIDNRKCGKDTRYRSMIRLCLLDLELHGAAARGELKTVEALKSLEEKNWNENYPYPFVDGLRSSVFDHLFTDSYAVGYYGYVWADFLVQDFWSEIKEAGNGSALNSPRLKDFVALYYAGGKEDEKLLFEKLKGSSLSVHSFLKSIKV